MLFAYMAFGRIDWHKTGAALAQASIVPLIAALALLSMDFTLRVLRWWWMLRKFDDALPAKVCFAPFMSSIAANNVLPLRAGDVLRIVGFRHAIRAPAMRILGTMLIERLLDLFTLIAIFFACLHGVTGESIPPAFVTAASVIALAAIAAMILLVASERLILRLVRRLEGAAGVQQRPWALRGLQWFEQVLATLMIFRSPGTLLTLIALSACAWLLEGGVFYCIALSLHLDVAAAGAWFSMSTGTLATLIPSSPGYVGTFDYFALQGIMAFGAKPDPAAAYTLLCHAAIWLPPTGAGGLFLALPRLRRLTPGRRSSQNHQRESESL
ncbi:MAG: flippase-like domain-containing protein [Planctomycetes bacterium]|nr:flippase-like domain-containing protein [Planctomycetota bacterium]